LLDVGCSTGNLLLHIRRTWPELDLSGADLAESSLAQARQNPELAGVDFQARDLMDLGWEAAFDIVVVNAVFYMLDDAHLGRALASVGRSLKPGGHLLCFDFFHPYAQDLAIFEKSVTHPEGLMLHFRPMPKAEAMLGQAGFDQAEFMPFVLPIELERSPDPAVLNTYTQATREGANLAFRGVLYQPWCHLKARRQV
jgi:SAM-dependent methyltransferase